MACMEHICSECGQVWFDNQVRPPCPMCGNSLCNAHIFDEDPEDY